VFSIAKTFLFLFNLKYVPTIFLKASAMQKLNNERELIEAAFSNHFKPVLREILNELRQ
jgi:hypothetical protein